jgi:hypothetical protein
VLYVAQRGLNRTSFPSNPPLFKVRARGQPWGKNCVPGCYQGEVNITTDYPKFLAVDSTDTLYVTGDLDTIEVVDPYVGSSKIFDTIDLISGGSPLTVSTALTVYVASVAHLLVKALVPNVPPAPGAPSFPEANSSALALAFEVPTKLLKPNPNPSTNPMIAFEVPADSDKNCPYTHWVVSRESSQTGGDLKSRLPVVGDFTGGAAVLQVPKPLKSDGWDRPMQQCVDYVFSVAATTDGGSSVFGPRSAPVE